MNTNGYDYRYLVTYLPERAAHGLRHDHVFGYKFRIRGNPATATVIELGGSKVGVKATL